MLVFFGGVQGEPGSQEEPGKLGKARGSQVRLFWGILGFLGSPGFPGSSASLASTRDCTRFQRQRTNLKIYFLGGPKRIQGSTVSNTPTLRASNSTGRDLPTRLKLEGNMGQTNNPDHEISPKRFESSLGSY